MECWQADIIQLASIHQVHLLINSTINFTSVGDANVSVTKVGVAGWVWSLPQGHHLSLELKTPKTRNRKMAAAEVYK